jgi:hypothetical protein
MTPISKIDAHRTTTTDMKCTSRNGNTRFHCIVSTCRERRGEISDGPVVDEQRQERIRQVKGC